MIHYTITIKTAPGQGDNGSGQQIVHDKQLNLGQLARVVVALEERGKHVCVYRGKGMEILQYETDPATYAG